MKNYGKVASLVTICYVLLAAILAIAVGLRSPTEGTEAAGGGYFLLIALLLLPCLPVALRLRRDPFSLVANAIVGLSFALYPSLGQWYHPGFESVLFVLLTVYAMFFHPPRALFLGVTVLGSGILSFVYLIRTAHSAAVLAHPSLSYEILAIWLMLLLALTIFLGFSRERANREAALERLGLIGRHASAIIHDVKNMMATPHLQVQSLRELLKGESLPDVDATLAELQASVVSVNRVIFDLNQMVSLAGTKEETLSLAGLVRETQGLLAYKLKDVEVLVAGDLEVHGNRTLLYSVLVTVFLDSLNAFQRAKIEHPRIEVTMLGSRFLYRDNSGPQPLADSVKDLGRHLVETGVAEFGGKARYLEDPLGTKVAINFQKEAGLFK